ncbi:MAG: hypothetical protein E6Q60_04320 [Nitrosomonas oligotropha]|uniref:Uncharacterized protein n=1 Tax=Nitrosomonas oligotropha TaxID=42354 RepID=A0A5C7VXZ5_9PROT|nr:MAG: hypothetical protein E6Q60_04320 [Nitrosomonas oligotropha]
MKRLILSACAFVLIAHIQFAFATTSTDTEKLLNWAEKTFPQFFPSPQATQNIEPWLFRYYPETGVYAGVNKSDNAVYVLGGPWGNNPTLIDTLANLISQVDSSGGNGGIAACDTSNTLSGVSYSQSGNVVTVTTGSSCVVLPDLSTTNLCTVPSQTTASGIHALGSNTITSSTISGITISIPGLPDPFSELINSAANVKHCTINAPAGTENLTVNSNLCLDITTVFSKELGSISIPGVAVTPPITYTTTGTYKNAIVADCFATDAATITDAFTGEAWVKQDGRFVKVK